MDPHKIADRLESVRGDREAQHAIVAGVVEALTADSLDDRSLVAAYQRTNGEPGNPEADALAAEIEKRGLDV